VGEIVGTGRSLVCVDMHDEGRHYLLRQGDLIYLASLAGPINRRSQCLASISIDADASSRQAYHS
jgi:hypothetical protein